MNLFFSLSFFLTSIIIKDVKNCIDHLTNLADGLVFVELTAFVLMFPSLQNSSRLSGAEVNNAKDEFEDHSACLLYHSTVSVFHQPVGGYFTSQSCPFSKLMRFSMIGLFLRKRETSRCPVLDSTSMMPSL